MLIKFLCGLCAVAVVSTFPMGGFRGQTSGGAPSDFFSKFLPKGIMGNFTSNPILQWIPGFVSHTINAARERKMMKQMQQSLLSDVEMGGLGGLLAQSSGGSTGLSLSSRGGQGMAKAADYPMTDFIVGRYGGVADGLV